VKLPATARLADVLGGQVVEVVDEYRPGLFQVRLDGTDFVISSHVLRLEETE
jgi:hypothetical protein